jgi:hypothetical protein
MAETAMALEQADCSDLAVRLHAAVDDVLGRYGPDHADERADRAILDCLREVEKSFLKKSPQTGQLLLVEWGARPTARPFGSAECRSPDAAGADHLAGFDRLDRGGVPQAA